MTPAEVAAVEMSLFSDAGCVLGSQGEGSRNWKNGISPGEVVKERRGLVTGPLVSKHCQTTRLRCPQHWIRVRASVKGTAGNTKAEVDNVQIEMLLKILNKWWGLSVNSSEQMPTLPRGVAGQLAVGAVLAQHVLALAENFVLTLSPLSAYR